VYNAPLSAAHWAKEKRHTRLLHLRASRLRGQSQFFNPQQTIIVGIKHNQRMIFMRQAQHFHRQVFQRQKQFTLVLQQEF